MPGEIERTGLISLRSEGPLGEGDSEETASASLTLAASQDHHKKGQVISRFIKKTSIASEKGDKRERLRGGSHKRRRGEGTNRRRGPRTPWESFA